jgi:protein-S-isoprenylcysteine O-methyltransferase Ste14
MLVKAFAGLAFLLAVLAAALFVPAATLAWWQAWVFLGVFGVAVTAITVDLALHDPALLARRTKAGPIAEGRPVQKVIQSLASLAFLAMFVVPALDHTHALVPAIAGDVLVAAGLAIVWRVFRANTFTSATIEVAREQQLVSTGPYAVVRHPMYAGALVMCIGVPLALGSWWGFAPVAVLVAVIVWRLLDEERTLATDLPGYVEYRARVRYRLVPGVW